MTAAVTHLLADDEPPAFEVVNGDGRGPCVLVCDHASNRLPRALGDLGLEATDLERHIAYDIGAAAVALGLARQLDAPLVLSGYSRLVIDLNRHPGSPTSVPLASEDVVIPGNHDLSEAQIAERMQALFWPYHDAVADRLERYRGEQRVPALISVHSFTPAFLGRERPWHVGVLWHHDQRIALPLIKRLNAEPDLCVGDNEPYSARNPEGYTVETHSEKLGYPGVLLEIRQDLITSTEGVDRWEAQLGRILADILSDPSIYYIEQLETP